MQNSNTLYSKIRFKIALGILACYASVTPAHAIPSPELIIGSVSSLSQILAVGFAMVSGAVAAFGAKFGLKPKIGSAHSGLLVKSILVLVLILSGSVGYNIYQSGQVEAKEQLRLHQTLIRPAQFSGTKIKDENLKETSLAAQKKSGLGISTAMAEAMLNTKENSKETLFLDVRERAEYQMGTVPGARHIRFPDIATAGLALADKKVVLLCHNGNRSSETCERLAAMGIDCSFIAGGLEKWIVEGRSFTDASVRGLSDLRAVPAFKNKDELIGTEQFTALLAADDIQIVDTRYPKDFASGHLPNAINIPLRALPTIELEKMLSGLEKKPTVVACYDRRSCFMGLEMSQRGIDFLGRYTTPWDYFIAPPTKPHIQAWLSGQNKTLWGRAIDLLSGWLLLAAEKSHFLIGVLGLSLLSRLMILPIALKSEKDQIAVAAHKDALASLKKRLKHDPTRRARAVQAVHNEMGLTPLRNMTALLFLPVMMLGLSAIEQAAPLAGDRFLWIGDLGNIDPAYLFPMSFTILAGLYLQMTLARTVKQRMLSWGLAVPLLFAMVFKLTAAGTIYLNISLVLLLLQRAYVAGGMTQLKFKLRHIWRKWQVRVIFQGIVPLHYADLLKSSGNKAYRLAVMSTAGFSVPIGVVAGNAILQDYPQMSEVERRRFFDRLWHMVGQKTCVVRSS